jgi:CelD/BcsL family acetyltransferase involved in cellulose biosynthesis
MFETVVDRLQMTDYTTPFTSEVYQQLWSTHVAPSLKILTRRPPFVIIRQSVLKGLLPLRVMRLAGWEHDWAQPFSSELGRQLITFAQQTSRWDLFRITSRCQDHENLALTLSQLVEHGFETLTWQTDGEFIIDVSQGWQPYWESLSSKCRCELRRKIKKAESLQPEWYLLNHRSDVESLLEQFLDEHTRYWQDKNVETLYRQSVERTFFHHWAMTMMADETMRFYGMYLNGQLASMRFGIFHHQNYYSLMTINTGAYQEYSPGVLAMIEEIHAVADAGACQYNMGPGRLRYKEQLAQKEFPYTTVFGINPKSIRGRLALAEKRHSLVEQGLRPA